MPRYYFNVIGTDNNVLDLEGSELSDIDHAFREATQDARFLMSHAILEGRDVINKSMEICDEDGNVLLIVPFASAVSRSD